MNDKKAQILQAAIGLFCEDGVGVATSKIAKKAGVSNGTLFNYFDTKQDLIDGVYISIKKSMANEIISGIDLDSEMKVMLCDVWELFVSWARKHQTEHQVMELLRNSQLLSEDVKKAEEHYWAVIYKTVEKGVKDGKLIKADAMYLCELAAGQLNATITYVHANKLGDKDVSKLISTSFEIYWSGISRS